MTNPLKQRPVTFRPATKQAAKLKLLFDGPSGSGKTYSSLKVAAAIIAAEGGEIALADTEGASASKYADLFNFQTIHVDPPYDPAYFEQIIDVAEANGFTVLIIDSLTHAYAGEGGLLDQNTTIARTRFSGNSYMAWSVTGPMWDRLMDKIIRAKIHIIATARAKQTYVETETGGGKKRYEKAGMDAQLRDSTDYTFDLAARLDVRHVAEFHKSRCPALADRLIEKPGAEVAEVLLEWLAGAPPLTDDEWRERAAEADTLFGWSRDIYNTVEDLFDSAAAVEKWFNYYLKEFNEDTRETGQLLLDIYAANLRETDEEDPTDAKKTAMKAVADAIAAMNGTPEGGDEEE